MRVTISGKNIQVTDAVKAYAEQKLQRLTRYFNNIREAHVTQSIQRNWHIVEVQLEGDGVFLRGEERTPDMFTSIDAVVDKLERQIKRFKGRLLQRPREQAEAAALAEAEEEIPPGEEELSPAIVRTKRFPIKPMSPEEAALQMELLGHDFFAFLNADSQMFSLLYRRRDGNYGLLEFQ
ncbi:MAG: ribosome-associated translation inhibitor RaiA [Armatimonadetes bacterium]|nr:ribosome-associated translation inhibitor RaiA [Armatimonadota bacterium]